jgi:hypothetical protein
VEEEFSIFAFCVHGCAWWYRLVPMDGGYGFGRILGFFSARWFFCWEVFAWYSLNYCALRNFLPFFLINRAKLFFLNELQVIPVPL